ncbi:hypothetical protein HY798_02060 [Candidatus Falkowbacteria bacterium]|nr:hypothetical protein [Candidatus Falkowbacteria bacterium]
MIKKFKNFLSRQYFAADKRFFTAGLIFIFVLTLVLVNYVAAINTQLEGYKSLPNSTMTVSSPRGSKTVKNNSGNTYFIPTKTAAEWDSFTGSYSALNVLVDVCYIGSNPFNNGEQVDSFQYSSVGCAESCDNYKKTHTCQADGTWSNAPAYSYADCNPTTCSGGQNCCNNACCSYACCNSSCCTSGQICHTTTGACCSQSWSAWSACGGCTPTCDQSCTGSQSRSDGCGSTQTQSCTIAATGCSSPEVCYNHSCCTPQTCASLNKNCGDWADGCGGTVTCTAGATDHSGTLCSTCPHGIINTYYCKRIEGTQGPDCYQKSWSFTDCHP